MEKIKLAGEKLINGSSNIYAIFEKPKSLQATSHNSDFMRDGGLFCSDTVIVFEPEVLFRWV
jgi:hypothetical protein